MEKLDENNEKLLSGVNQKNIKKVEVNTDLDDLKKELKV